MKHVWRPVGRALVWLAGGIVALFLVGAVALAVAITSERGLRVVARAITSMSGGAVTFGAVQGRLTGTSQWRDFAFTNAAGLRVSIDALEITIAPRDLWTSRLHVTRLEVQGVEVFVPASRNPEPRAAPLALPIALPVDVIVDALVLIDGTLRVADAKAFHVERVELAGQWIGDAVEVRRLASGFSRTGPLALEGNMRMHADHVEIDKLVLRGPGEITARGTLGIGDAKSDLALQWRELHWPLVVEDAPAPLRDLAGEAKITGLLDEYRYEIAARGLAQEVPVVLSARGTGTLHVLRIETLQLQARDGTAQLQGELGWKDALRADFEAVIAKLDPSLFAPDWPGQVNATVRTRTTLREGRPDIVFDARIAPSKLRGQDLQGVARGSTDARSVRFEELAIRAGGGNLSAKGELAWSPAVAASLDAQLSQLDPATFFPDWPGRINGTAQLRTPAGSSPSEVRFDVTVDRSQLREVPLRMAAHGTWRAGALQIEELALSSGETRLTASGQATSPFDLTARLRSPDLTSLHPDLGGQLDADLKLTGALEQPHLVTRGSGRGLRWRGYRVAALGWQGDVDPAVPSRFEATLADADFGTKVSGAKVTARGIEKYQYLTLDAQTERGDVALALEGGYDRKRREWGGYLTSARVAPKDLPDWKLEKSAPMLIGRSRQSVEPACLAGGAGRTCIRLEQNVTGQGLRLYWDLDRLQLAAFKPLLPTDTTVAGEADGDGYIEIAGGDVKAIEAGVRLTGVRLARPNLPPFEMLPSTIKADQQDGRLHAVADLRLVQGHLTADVTAAPAQGFAQRPLSGRVQVDIPDLAFVSEFSSQMRNVRGRVAGALELGGTPALPRLRGNVALTDGQVRLVTPGIEVKDIQWRLSGNGEGPLSIDGSMKSGDGVVRLAGTVDPARAPPRADVTLKGEQFQAVATPDARIWITPDLRLASDDTGIHLDGSLTVPRAEITPRKGLGDQGVAVSSDQVLVGAEPVPQGTPLKLYSSVRMVLGDAVSFKGFGLTTRLAGSVTVNEEPLRDTSAQGALILVGGRYKAYGQDLNIETGRLLFDGGPVTRPAVDLYATRKPQNDVTIGVRVRGTLNRPELSLQSDPPMPREEQLSWLVLGRPLDASSASDRSALTQAALSLGVAGGDYFAQRIGKGVGLDTLTIAGASGGSAVAADAGTIQGSQASRSRGTYVDQTQAAQLTLGKYLTPKLFVSYGVSLFQPGQTFRLLYDLGAGFKLQSESGVANGADLLYTFER